jgi:hypothetical protein
MPCEHCLQLEVKDEKYIWWVCIKCDVEFPITYRETKYEDLCNLRYRLQCSVQYINRLVKKSRLYCDIKRAENIDDVRDILEKMLEGGF